MDWSSIVTLVSTIVLYPLAYVAYFGYLLLKLLVSPLIFLSLYILHFALLPWRIFLKFEAICIYFGVALLTGAILGLVLYFVTTLLIDLLNRTLATPSTAQVKFRFKSRQRSGLESTKDPSHQSHLGSIIAQRGGRKDSRPLRDAGLLSETILEEEEDPGQDSEWAESQ